MRENSLPLYVYGKEENDKSKVHIGFSKKYKNAYLYLQENVVLSMVKDILSNPKSETNIIDDYIIDDDVKEYLIKKFMLK